MRMYRGYRGVRGIESEQAYFTGWKDLVESCSAHEKEQMDLLSL